MLSLFRFCINDLSIDVNHCFKTFLISVYSCVLDQHVDFQLVFSACDHKTCSLSSLIIVQRVSEGEFIDGGAPRFI